MPRTFGTVGVVGLGIMGAGIAEVFARGGLTVIGFEPDAEALERGRGHLERSTGRAVQRGRLSEDEQIAMLERVRYTTRMDELAACDLVVEAVPELLDLKRAIFGELDEVCRPDTILATNTSSLSVTDIAVSTARADRVVGMHFFNPAPVMKLVEVVRTVLSSAEVITDVEALAQRVGKVDITIDDRAGFVANALLFGYLNHAVSMYESGFASREDIDAAMTVGHGLPMGPLALLDLIGIDTGYAVLQAMYEQTRNRRHAAAPTVRQLTVAGLLGRKTGRGFYTYEGSGSAVVVDDDRTPDRGTAVSDERVVRQVAVVGSTASARALGELLADSDAEVTAVAVATAAAGDGARELDVLATADLVVAVLEAGAALDHNLMTAVGARTPTSAVLALLTDGTPVTGAAAATGRPADAVGLRVLDGPEDGRGGGRLVEIVRTVATSASALATARVAVEQLGVRAVVCGDRAGFLADALLVPYLNDAAQMLDVGYATAEDIDAAMTLGCGYPIGPIEALDRFGLDTALAIQQRMHAESSDPGLAPAPLLRQLVTAGRLGGATGRGVREHPDG